MTKKNTKEKKILMQCAEEGFRLLGKYFQYNAAERFLPAPFISASGRLDGRFDDFLYSDNADLFYSILSFLNATEDERLVKESISCKDLKTDQARSLEFIEEMLYCESQFERDLADCIQRHTLCGDDEIRNEFSSRFDVSPLNLLDLPTDRSIYFAKVNHGYWEYMRGAYDSGYEEREQFRDIGLKTRIRRLRTSGVTQFWGWQIARYFMDGRRSIIDRRVSLCVSLTAGNEPVARTIRKGLTPVTRGAAIGLMSMFETAIPEMKHYCVGDGLATRSLIFGKTLEDFFDKYVADSEACVFVVPPHLKRIDFVNYSGAVYKFVVPPTRVNETWKTVAATLLGYLTRVSKKHRTITVLVQSASIASLMALLFSDIDPIPNVRLRYFDLGRVLDVATPEFLSKQSWANKNMDEYVAEGKKVFRNVDDAAPILASGV